jgi:peroxiredoxin
MRLFAVALPMLVAISFALLANTSRTPERKPIADFTLPDHHGRTYSLSDQSDKKLVVVVFLGSACPLAQAYAPVLAGLADTYGSRGVGFIGINANAQDTLADIAAYVRDHKLPFPILRDPDQAIADRFGAERTPHAFVLDERRVIRYQGRIDDWASVGVKKARAERHDLVQALENLLAGRAVARPNVPAVGCKIGRTPRIKHLKVRDVTYSAQIQPILERRCVACHRTGEIAPFPLTAWKEVAPWSVMIREVVEEGRMPPWQADPRFGHFRNDARLSAEEKRLLLQWIDDGCPEGAATHATPPSQLVPGWGIPQPDLVLPMSEQPFKVSAEQALEYQHFLVDPGFRADKFVRAAEVRPGNRAVVHHALVSLVRPDTDGALPDSLGAMLNYAPGMQPTKLPDGWAIRVPAGSKFLFQMHYTPNGVEQTDRSVLGLVFADPKTVKHQVRGGAVFNPNIDIPLGAKNHREVAEHTFAHDVRLLSLSPHMHLRGKSFRIEAVMGDGRRDILLDVPRYDFHWQLRYELAEPRRLPAGARLICTATYDNSAANPANPDPRVRVQWGDQTWNEMLIGFIAYVEE